MASADGLRCVSEPVDKKNFHFNHPYPAVQDSEDFDTNFVKDENSDGGKWQAQMDYDVFRNKVRQAENDLTRVKSQMATEKHEMDMAHAKWQDEQRVQQRAHAEVSKVKDAMASTNAKGLAASAAVTAASGAVEKETKDLEKCKK